MKRFLVLFLAFILVIPGFAVLADSSEMEKVLLTVKERIGSTEDYDRMDSQIYAGVGSTCYNFYWQTEGEEEYKSLSVTATASGIITSYYSFDGDRTYNFTPSIKRMESGEAMAKAEKFVNQLNPQLAGSIKLINNRTVESLVDYRFSFQLQRYENGIPVWGDEGNICVSENGEQLISFDMVYTEELTFPKSDKFISYEQAKTAFGEKIGMELYYSTKTQGRERTAIAVYAPAGNSNQYISALTGEVVSPVEFLGVDGGGMHKEDATNFAVAEGAADELSPAETAELERVEGLISKAKAEEIIRTNKVVNISESYNLSRIALSKDYYDENRYYYNIRMYDKENGNALYAQVDAVNGNILSFNKDLSFYKEPAISAEEMKEIAKSAVSTLAGDLLKEYRWSEDESTFSLTRYVNDIPYYDNSITVSVDEATGQVVSYEISYTDMEFPSLENVLAPDKAAEKMFESIAYEKAYVKSRSEEKMPMYDTALAVYKLEDGASPVIDAVSGEPLYKRESAQVEEYTDIEGHYGEYAIKTLKKFGIGFAGGLFKPDDTITQKDFVALLLSAFKSGEGVWITDGMDYSGIYRIAQLGKVITPEEYDPEGAVTRENAAVFTIRAIGFEEVAKIPGIYNCPFTDVNSNIGYITILSGMGVLKGNGLGQFNPADVLTRADAAILIYNCLSK